MRKKFTMLLTALLCCVGVAKAQITSLEELKNGKAYTIVGERGFIAANEGFVMGSNNGPLSGATLETSNAMHQFAIITYENVSYLYSVGAEKFVMKDGNKASLVDFPIHSIEIVAAQDQNTNFDWIIKLNGKYMNLSNSSENGVYTNYDSEDGGNRWSITEIGEFNSQEAETVISLGLASERLALQKAINNASSYYEAMKDKNTEEAQTLNDMISEAQESLTSDAETAESLSEKILNIDLLLYNLISEYDLSSQAFYLKNASTGLYMTLVSTNENIKVCDFDYTNENQVFNIVGTNESYVYKVKSSTGYYLKTTGNWDYKASETDDDGGKHTLAYVGEGKYTLTGSKGLIGPNSGSAKNNDPIYSNHGTNNSNIYWVLEPQDERLKSILLEEIESATTVYDKLESFTCDEITTLGTAINTANGVYENSSATVDAIIEQIGSLPTAKDEASLYPCVKSLLKTIEPGKYFIYYTDENSVKHYLHTKGSNNVVTVTENPISYDIQVGTTADGKYDRAYLLKMNNLYISNTGNGNTTIETKGDAQLWSSQVLFEKNGKCAIRLTNATTVDGWHGNYLIGKGETEGTTVALDPSKPLEDAMFIWTVEPDLQGMRDELASLKTAAETKVLEMTVETAPVKVALTKLSEAINYAENKANSNVQAELDLGLTQLNAAIALANDYTFYEGSLATLEQGEYVIYYEAADGAKYYLGNVGNRVKSSVNPTIYDVTNGNITDGYVDYAYFFKMNDTYISNPTDDNKKEIQADGRADGRIWESQVLYVNANGKYAIRSTNCPAGSGWNSDAFITISDDGATVIGQNTDLSDALYKWNIEKVTGVAGIDKLKYPSLQAAIDAATEDQTVTMLADVALSTAATVNKTLTIDMKGKTLTSAGDGFKVTAGTLTITGQGTVNAGTTVGQWVAVWAKGGNVVIENGTFSVAAGEDNETNDCIYAKGGEITINGGTFSNAGTYNPSHGGVVINAHNTVPNSKVTICGGTFTPAEGCVITEEGDVTAERVAWTPVTEEVLKVALTASSVVTLGADIDLTSSVAIIKDVTVNLNDKSIKCNSSDVFVVTEGTLTLNGDGVVYGSEENSSSACAVWAKDNGHVIINGGTYKVGDDTKAGDNEDNWRNDCIYARDNGVIEINGGEFMYTGENPEGHKFLLNCRDEYYNAGTAKIIVKGGKFHNFNPANNAAEGAGTCFVPVTHHSEAGNEADTDTYVVTEGCVINDSDYKIAGKKFVVEETVEGVDITYTRTFGHTDWQVLFVPFEIKVNEALLTDFEVYEISNVNSVRVEVTGITGGTLSASTPYLIKAREIGTKTITVEGGTLVKTEAYEKSYGKYTFYSNYEATAIEAESSYVLTGGKWCQLTDKAVTDNANVLGAFRVYLTAPVPDGTPANALSITRGETAIETLDAQPATEAIYDLSGRRVTKMEKGIYIVNGKKVIK